MSEIGAWYFNILIVLSQIVVSAIICFPLIAPWYIWKKKLLLLLWLLLPLGWYAVHLYINMSQSWMIINV